MPIDSPAFVFETRNVPCKTNPLGVKGAGEAGAIGSCPAVMNAVIDALWRTYRIRHIDMPATPQQHLGGDRGEPATPSQSAALFFFEAEFAAGFLGAAVAGAASFCHARPNRP